MATAADYAVNFGYRAQDGYYYGDNGRVGKYHRGNDRPCPWNARDGGTAIVIGSTTIGYTGATGLVSGPHLHTQACTAGSNYADDFDPSPFEFKYGLVVKTGVHSQFGNHIVIRVGNVDITYAHLSQINVSVGQTVGQNTLKPNQRILENRTGVNQRSGPSTSASIIKEWPYDLEPFTFKGYVRGEAVNGNNVWFVGAFSGGYFSSVAFLDKSTNGLPDLTPTTVTPTPEPPKPDVYPSPTNDPLVTQVYNKKNPVGDYAPVDLVSAGSQQLRKEAADSLALMQGKAALPPASGYRSRATQKTVYDAYVAKDGKEAADRYSARPGYSEHQTGLAMDFAPIDDTFGSSAAYKWLTTNAYKYGWILRYPADKEEITGYISEPWHWRYVGVTVATDMKDKKVTTLEEYFNIEGGDYPTVGPAPGDLDKENNALLKQILAIVQSILDKIGGIFK